MIENREYLFVIKDSIDKILDYTNKISFKEFESDSLTQDAVLRRFDTISYACANLSKDIKDKIDFIPWERIIDIKSKLVTDDLEVNTSKIWEIVKEDLPILKDDINKVVHEYFQ